MKKLILCLGVLSLVGCNVESKDESTGGVAVRGDELCPAGVTTILSDFVSTQVALLDKEGQMLSDSFISSGSTMSSGVATPLSGDIVAPSNRPASGEVVLVDRYPNSVVTWVDAESAEVRAQLPVGTGFSSNPYDYLELSPTKAYVPRYESNAAGGAEPFDDGGDILIIDPSAPAITGNIPLSQPGALPPRPSALTQLGKTVLVVLQNLAQDYSSTDDAQIVGIDSEKDEEIYRVTLTGLKTCGRAMLSPSSKIMALGCTGEIDMNGALVDPAATGIVLLDATVTPPTELKRIDIHAQLGFAPQPQIEFASEGQILAKTQTPYFGEGNNQLFVVDVESEEVRVLAEASPNDDGTGKGVTFGGLLCTPSCNSTCLMADADSGLVRRFDIETDFAELDAVGVGSSTGLSPTGLGPF